MSADRFDRFDRVFADALADLAEPRFPDYFDVVLEQAVRPAQRPAWTFPERWLPMSAITRRLVLAPQVPWRTVALLALLAVLLAAAFVFVGSQRGTAPPFGVARNGLLAYSQGDDLFTRNAATGEARAIVTGPGVDVGPWFSRDGSRLGFVRLEARDHAALWAADPDGTNARALTPPISQLGWWDWSPDGRMIAFESKARDGLPVINVVATDGSSAPRALTVGMGAQMPTWLPPNGAEIMFRGFNGRASGLFAIRPDGSGLRPLTPTDGNLDYGYMGRYGLSSDGELVAYTEWEGQSHLRVHVLNLRTGEDHARVGPKEEADPIFSPDNTLLAVTGRDQSVSASSPVAIFVSPVNEPDNAVQVGPTSVTEYGGGTGLGFDFSPDGLQLVIIKHRESTSWLAPVTGGEGELLVGGTGDVPAWQRLPPSGLGVLP